MSDELPSVEMETNEEEGESTGCREGEDDVDEVDPFSEDSGSALDGLFCCTVVVLGGVQSLR